MHGNKEAYDDAYNRTVDGKLPRPFWGYLMLPFEDDYTRRSIAEGRRDGLAAREVSKQPETERVAEGSVN